MILQTELVEQVVEGEERARFVKEVIASREGRHPIAMVRKRLEGVKETRGAVLLIHGFGQNRYTWHTSKRSFSNHLACAGFDVFNVDLRGRGRSRKFGARDDTNLDDYIREDVPAALETVVRLSEHKLPFLVGHSMGGLISYSAAGSSLRGRIGGIVTIGSPYRFGRGSLFLKFAAPAFYAARLTGLFDTDPAVPVRFIGQHLKRRRKLWDSRYIPMPMRVWAPGSMEPEILEENLQAAFEHTRMGIALGIVSMGRESALKSHDGLLDYGLAFELTDLPLLVIAGTFDGLAPPESVKPAIERSRSSDKTFREFPLGHIDLVLGRDAPFSVWPLVRTWLTARAERASEESVRAESA
jgi:polyhydroxyalkanoate synthase